MIGDEELRWYAAIVAASALAIALCLLRRGFSGVEPALRASFFHVVSLITTTGFVTENYDLWPEFARFLLLILMVVGACAPLKRWRGRGGAQPAGRGAGQKQKPGQKARFAAAR